MPGLNNNGLDDPPIFDETVDFRGGQVSNARRNLLGPTQFFRGINTMVAKDGQIVTRRGSTALGAAGGAFVQGLAYLDTGSTERLLRVSNGVCEQHTGVIGTSWSAAGGFSPDATAQMEIIQALGKLYLHNGVDAARSWDGTSFASLGTGTSDCPIGKYAVWFQNRMFVAGRAQAPDTVYFCDILDPSNGHWDHVAKSFAVSAGDGDEIRGIAGWTNTTLAIFKRSSLWLANVDPTLSLGAQIPLKLIHATIGCLSHRTIKQVGTDLWFLADDGVRSIRRVLQGEEQEVSVPISRPVNDVFERMNRAAAHTACAAVVNGRYLIAIPVDGATQPNYVLAFNTETQQWEGEWTGLTPTIFCRSYMGGLERLQWGQANGKVLQWRNWVLESAEADSDYRDDGAEIPTAVRLRSHTFGEPRNLKRALAIELEFDKSTADEVTVTAYPDETTAGVEVMEINSGLGGATFPVVFPFMFAPLGIKRASESLLHLDPFRELAVDVTSTRFKLALRAVRLSAFLDSMPLGQ